VWHISALAAVTPVSVGTGREEGSDSGVKELSESQTVIVDELSSTVHPETLSHVTAAGDIKEDGAVTVITLLS